ncbi:MAG: methylthioadenosine phosphorylase [Gammaproteobacteria bacterium RIFOXYB2_FULL_38_6]|nr:MAG: methylthioadenosine phosphorylase [Gammaproteobacteria bacterium RIFOXYB2_FULL_38_6]
MREHVNIGIIGGSGICNPDIIKNTTKIKTHTPYGRTSDLITLGEFAGVKVAFIPRHGGGHDLPPHLVPYRANLYALKQLGVQRVFAPAAVGSLQEEIRMGDLVICDQFFDWTKGREYSSYNGGQVAHASLAEPFCSELRELCNNAAEKLAIPHHKKGTNITIEGPRYSSRAESLFFKNALKADVIGMTLIPECVIARELELCYVCIAAATDYDAWKQDEENVSHASVEKVMKENIEKIKALLTEVIPQVPEKRERCVCPHAMEKAII